MFQFTGLASYTYVFSARRQVFNLPGCPIRKSPDQRLLAPPRSLSQLATSFIAYPCQGIHRVPLTTYTFAFLSLSDFALSRPKSGSNSVRVFLDTSSIARLHPVPTYVKTKLNRGTLLGDASSLTRHGLHFTKSKNESRISIRFQLSAWLPFPYEHVELLGLEPRTPCLQSRCSTN